MDRYSETEFEEYLNQLEASEQELTEYDIDILYAMSAQAESWHRSRIAALLVDHYHEKSIATLLRLTRDTDELVRTEAADSLCIGQSFTVIDRLSELAANDPSNLVRGYAVLSLFAVFSNIYNDESLAARETQKVLNPLFEQEEDVWTMVNYAAVLYQCGDMSMLQHLIDALHNENSTIRCVTVNSFFRILTPENEPLIRGLIGKYHPDETALNVREVMEKLLNYIDGYEWQ